jgi:hypothetical protein
MFIAPIHEALSTLASGLYVLIVDFQAYPISGITGYGVGYNEDGHLLMFGQLKRSLLQSLPFLGLLPLFAYIAINEKHFFFKLLLLIVGFWVLPFAYRYNHGGSPVHMRHFFAILPFTSIMTAVAIAQLGQSAVLRLSDARVLIYFSVGIFIITAVVFWGVLLGETLAIEIATKGSLALTAGAAIGCVLFMSTGAASRRFWARATLTAALAGIVWAGTSNVVHDFFINQVTRSQNGQSNVGAEQIPDDSLVLAHRAFIFMPQLLREGSYVGVPYNVYEGTESVYDDVRGLIEFHLSVGRQVFAQRTIADRLLDGVDDASLRKVSSLVHSEVVVEVVRD